jgi:hypothetical protein
MIEWVKVLSTDDEQPAYIRLDSITEIVQNKDESYIGFAGDWYDIENKVYTFPFPE